MVAEGGQDISVDVHRAQQMVSELLGSVSYRNRDDNISIRVTLMLSSKVKPCTS